MSHNQRGYELGLSQFRQWVSADKLIQQLHRDPSDRFVHWFDQFRQSPSEQKDVLLMALAAAMINANEVNKQ